MLPQPLQNLTDKKSRGRNLYTKDFQIALDLMNAGEDVTFSHPTTGNITSSMLRQLQEQMKAGGSNVADIMDAFDTGSQAGINRLLNAADGAYVTTDADEAENNRLIEKQKLKFAKNPDNFLRPEQPASSESIRLSPSYNSNQQNQSATDYIQSSVTAPKAPGGGLGKTPEVDKRRRLHQQQANVANKGNVKLQEATTNENILRVIIDSPLALMEYLNELKAVGDTKKLKTAGDAVLKHYKGIANFRERLREEQQFVSKGIGSSNKERTAGDEKHYNKPDISGRVKPVNAQTQQPQQEPSMGTTAKGLYNAGTSPNTVQPQQQRQTPPQPQPIAEDNRVRASSPNDKKITEISQKAARPDYEYPGNADDNVLDNDVRNPARDFRIAFAKADEGSIFEVNGQTYRKI
jgi:hypothetical protein